MSDAAGGARPDAEVAREVVDAIAEQLTSVRAVYAPVHQQVLVAGALEPASREAAIQALSSVATALRRLAPVLPATSVLPPEERPDVALVVLRLLTDSLSIALAETPARELMLDPTQLDELFEPTDAVSHA